MIRRVVSAASPIPITLGVAVAGLTLVPIGYLVVATLGLGWNEWTSLIFRPRVGDLLLSTGLLLVTTVAAASAIGVGAAVLVVRTDMPARGLWHAVLAAPLAVPAFVSSSGWVSLTHGMQSYVGAVLILSLAYYPLVYLPVVGALSSLDADLEEVAWSLGRSRRETFWTVVLPRIRPAVLGGGLLVSLHVLAEFGALQLLGYQTLTTAIYAQYRSGVGAEGGAALAAVLVLPCVTLLALELVLRGQRRLSRIGRGVSRRPELVRLAGRRVPAVVALTMLAGFAVGVPAVAMIGWMVQGSSTAFPLDELGSALGSTLLLAAGGAVLATALALAPAWLAVRRQGILATMLERSTYVANALPGIVVALALVFVSIRVAPAWYQTAPILLIAYAILFLPRAVVSVRASLEHAPPVLEETAHSLGQSGVATLRRVTLPLIAPGLGAAFALCFLAISTELTATLVLSPIGVRTLATEFWVNASSLQYGAAAPYAVLLVLVSVPATVLLARQMRPRTST